MTNNATQVPVAAEPEPPETEPVEMSGALRSGRPILHPRSAAAVTRWATTRWPRIGGPGLMPLEPDAFTGAEFLGRYRPGRHVFVYVAGCGEDMTDPRTSTGLLGLARMLWLPIYKVSASAAGDLRARARELNIDQYSSAYFAADGTLCRQAGFDNWALQQLQPNRATSVGSPIEILPRALRITLPEDVSLRQFEKLLAASMANAALDRWIVSDAGLRHCDEIGVDPHVAQRATVYNFGTDRVSYARELFIFRPRGDDADRLVTICERIVFGVVTGADSAPGGPGTRPWRSVNQGYRP